MDIEKLIARECKNDNEHDKFYEKALRHSFNQYKNIKDLGTIQSCLKLARNRFAGSLSSHTTVADCMVLSEMEKEIIE